MTTRPTGPGRRLLRHAAPLLCALLLAVPTSALAQAEGAVHWAYAGFLGSGWYRIGGDLDVFLLTVPPSWKWREPDPSTEGFGRVGVRFEVPVTLGVYRLYELDEILDVDNLGTISVAPGVELEYPVSDRWALKAVAHVGWGTGVGEAIDESAWSWDASLRSRYAFRAGALDWGIVGELFYAAYRTDGDDRGSLGGFLAAADFSLPVPLRSGTGEPLRLNWDVGYRWLADDLTFLPRRGAPQSVDDEWQLGVAFARRAGLIRIGPLQFEQIGLAWGFSSDGEFRAVTLNFNAPFSR